MMGQTVDQKLERLKESVDAKEDLELELKRDLTLAYDELERERASSRALRQAYSKAEAELARAHEACALAITARNQAADGPAKPTALCPLALTELTLCGGTSWRIVVANQSIADVSLAGWSLVAESSPASSVADGSDTFEFPDDCLLAAGCGVRIADDSGGAAAADPHSRLAFAFGWPRLHSRPAIAHVRLLDPNGDVASSLTAAERAAARKRMEPDAREGQTPKRAREGDCVLM